MELNELKTTLDLGEPLRHYYVFWCEDRSMADVYIDQMCFLYKMEKAPRDTVAQAIREANSPSLFEGSQTLYVVRDDDAFAKDEKGWKALTALTQNVVVAIYTADKRTAFANAVDAVWFRKMDKQVIAEYMVLPNHPIGMPKALWLAEACDCLYGLTMAECDKIEHLAKARNISQEGAFDELASKGQLGLRKENETFVFVNSFVLGDVAGTFGSLEMADAMGFISMLYAQCKSMYLVDCNANSRNIVADTGLTFNQINAYRHKRRRIRTPDLPKVMGIAQAVESGIKLGRIPSEFALRYLLATCWGYVGGNV